VRVRILQGLAGARAATGEVVVIDVLRAFTTAAHAFAAGIEEIELVGTVAQAFERPGFRMGEVDGRWIPGFDHSNSPSELAGRRLAGRAVLRTSSGTQGVVNAARAEGLWLGSLVVAGATARALAGAREVSLVAMGAPGEDLFEEDLAGALYLEALLRGETPPRERALAMVRASRAAALFRHGDRDRPVGDVDCACAIDAFDFAMRAEHREGRILARPWRA
jgi:2-phosphosulfolactate phosphatase